MLSTLLNSPPKSRQSGPLFPRAGENGRHRPVDRNRQKLQGDRPGPASINFKRHPDTRTDTRYYLSAVRLLVNGLKFVGIRFLASKSAIAVSLFSWRCLRDASRRMDDTELLREFAARHSEEAFRNAGRAAHWLGLFGGLAQLRNPTAAEEATQSVFIDLAAKAARLSDKTILSGWLFRRALCAAKMNPDGSPPQRREREQPKWKRSSRNNRTLPGNRWSRC